MIKVYLSTTHGHHLGDPLPDSVELDAAAAAAYLQTLQDQASNAAALQALNELDLASIRGLREFLVAKFGTDLLLPAELKANEAAAAAERVKVKK